MALVDIIKKGSTSRSVPIYVFDNTTGLPKTGLTNASAGLDLWYRRELAALTSITEVAGSLTAFTSGGFIEVGNGDYELDIPDAALASGANFVDYGGTLTGNTVVGGRIRLINVDLEIDGGAAGGLFIAGTNAATTITSAAGNALTLSSTGGNGHGMALSGNGTGSGMRAIGGNSGGSGIAGTGGTGGGEGIRASGGAGSGMSGLRAIGDGGAAGIWGSGGATGNGMSLSGGATSGHGLGIGTTSGDGINVNPTNGHGVNIHADGSSKHGIISQGGTAGVSDGIKGLAGTGGVDIRGLVATANVTQFNGTAVSMNGGFPQVDVATMVTAVATQIRDAVYNGVVDDSSLASAAAITTQVTLKQALSLCTAFAAGRSTNSGQRFLTIDNVKVRIDGTATANNRTAVSATPSG